jgi:DNA-binding transcriptional ArsR family regulator
VSQHLRVLREQEFVVVRSAGTRRLYELHPTAFDAANAWLAPFHDQWVSSLDALGTEIARGQRQRRRGAQESTPAQRKESA